MVNSMSGTDYTVVSSNVQYVIRLQGVSYCRGDSWGRAIRYIKDDMTLLCLNPIFHYITH